MDWKVHKFGGSSLGTSSKIKKVARLIIEQSKSTTQTAVVLSAMEGVTDQLLQMYHQALERDNKTSIDKILNELISHHQAVIEDLIEDNETKQELLLQLDEDEIAIEHLLHGLTMSKAENQPIRDVLSGFGELWTSKLVTLLLRDMGVSVDWIDSRSCIVIDEHLDQFEINWEESGIHQDIDSEIVIFPGYIASTTDGSRTTLGRNGSDLSAAILSVLLEAEELHIWTDVDGIFSADPRRVEDVRVLDHLSYLETLEMSYFGAEILHPKSIFPVINKNIPIIVRNTFNPGSSGTRVSLRPPTSDTSKYFVKGFASIDSIALVTIEGAGMIGVPGISETLFRALRKAKISVIMISQASSEFSISVAVNDEDGEAAKKAIEREFDILLARGTVRGVKLERNCAILAVVGDNMVNQPGIAAMLFTALSRSRINVRMISQGSSERNISVIVDEKDITRGLNAAHSAFYLSHVTISLGIIGIGLIGSSLLQQIFAEQKKLREELNIDLQINGIMNSTKMLKKRRIQEDDLAIIDTGEDAEIHAFTEFIQRDSIPHTVVIDCTASEKISKFYLNWLERGIHVITPNKKANSADFSLYRKLRDFIEKGPATNPLTKNTYYFYETTVGAGLPIIQTMKDLINTGDKVQKIEGVFSGTLSYIFNSMTTSDKFSEIVRVAKEKGYTEPDPRDDLSGTDVARKLIILAREIGLQVDMDDVVVESLIPEQMSQSLSIAEFLDELPKYDEIMRNRLEEAESADQVLRYVGTVDEKGNCRVGIESLSKKHPFAHLNGSENIISFTTNRYKQYPLIVRGPGAGAEVTSAGIFADLLRLAERLGSA